jgi:hypothetical protein
VINRQESPLSPVPAEVQRRGPRRRPLSRMADRTVRSASPAVGRLLDDSPTPRIECAMFNSSI